MLDRHLLRENAGLVQETMKKRQLVEDLTLVDDWLRFDQEWRELKGLTDQLRAKRNTLSREINQLKKDGKKADSQIEEAKQIPEKIRQNDSKQAALQQKMDEILCKLPNILHESVPEGKSEADNKEVKKFGNSITRKFEPMSHVDIVEQQGWVDLERAAKLCGARWWFLQGELALLERAITNYAIDFITKKGFTLTIPPFVLGHKAYQAVADMDTFHNQLYTVDGEDRLHLIATSEHPLTAKHMDETLDASKLPIKLAGLSQCFRREAGAHGKDQKGIFRVHQFNKVEMMVYAHPEESWKLHEDMLKHAVEFWASLGLQGHVIILCSADTGTISAKTYDIEAWFPVQNAYREVVSCSNCTTYQAQGLNTRFVKGQERGFVHTLNSTVVATSRALVAIIENFQNEDGTVNIPPALQPFMTGKKSIGKKLR